ncbi:hypothetical protein ACFFV7_41220 [Nonomuraea spiralis]|uniref:Uncharacterized protein n=1 Tax=Nonomuraea spiralis TaxID=46182 RepID=A0ABV5ISW9_9ACTN|nr:hypothetical protein [Nonomuraea spiralis]GGT17071.1 hypothetical protein GCM10010176_072080 [Nonomuraea spiralis]
MTHSHRSLATVVAGAALLAAMTGCASTGQAQPSAAPAADSQNKQRQSQAQLAACMKGKGFTYHPVVSTRGIPEEQKKELSGDYEAMKKQRSKYGFGWAASIVYPNDPGGRMVTRTVESAGDDPNSKVIAGLTKAQRDAYFAAMETCMLEAYNKTTGRKMTSMQEVAKAQSKMIEQAINREVNGDSRLVELAGQFADCLKGKGYKVTSQQPAEVSTSTEGPFQEELRKLGEKPTAEQARPLLTREIKAALEDLECGRQFYAAYRPKLNAIFEQAGQFAGMGMSMQVAG